LLLSDAGAAFGSTTPSVSKPLQDFQNVKRQKSDKNGVSAINQIRSTSGEIYHLHLQLIIFPDRF
jgi:hypothetical protein